MLFPQQRNVTYAFEAVVGVLKLLESLLIFGLTIVFYIYLKVLFNKQFCHPNLRVLLIVQPCTQLVPLFIRVIQHSLVGLNVEFDQLNLIFSIVSDIAIVMSTQMMIMLAIERSWAMWTAITYEDSNSPLFAFLLSLIMLLYGTTFVMLWYLDWCSGRVVFIVSYTVMLVSCVIFAIFPIVCKRAHRAVSQTRYATVAQRFRASRNLQAARLLMYLAPYKCVANLFSLCIYISVFQNTNPPLLPLFAEFYFYYAVTQCFLFMLLTTTLHDSLRESLIKEIGFQIKFEGEKEPPKEILSVDGQKMIFSAKEEGRIYFDQLALEWGSFVDHKRWAVQQRRIHNERSSGGSDGQSRAQSRPQTGRNETARVEVEASNGTRAVRFEAASGEDPPTPGEEPFEGEQDEERAQIGPATTAIRDDPIITPILEKNDTIAEEDSLGAPPSSRSTTHETQMSREEKDAETSEDTLRDLRSMRMRYHRQTTITMSFDSEPKGDLVPRDEQLKRTESPWGTNLLIHPLPANRRKSRKRLFKSIRSQPYLNPSSGQ